ncbi:hypothetical protein IQ06DRAFT_178030, partial [Phaeosphaeriaceae sp. SRC1lsM3a]
STGTKIVRFTIPSTSRRFTVHEDLICFTLTLFASKLQPHRKPVLPTSFCSICHDALDPIIKEISYCAACGQNIHTVCTEKWKQRQIMRNGSRGEEEDALPSCPMCRATWKEQPLLKSVSVRENLDSGVVQMYIDWLYSRTLVIPTEISRKSDTFNVVLLKCWAVAAAMGDEMFRDAVIETFFAEAKARLWSESVKWTFVDDCGVKEIKDFVMEVFLAFVEPEWFRKESATWPEVFVGEVGERLLEGGRRREFDEIQRRW